MRRLLLVLCISGCGGDWSGTDLLFASALPRRAALHAPDGGEAWNASVDGLTAMSEQARAIPPLSRTDSARTWGPYVDQSDSTRELELVIDRTDDTHFAWRVETRISGGAWLRVITASADLGDGSGVIDSPVASYRASVPVIDAWATLDAISLRYDSAATTLTIDEADGGVTTACWTESALLDTCN